MKIGAYLSAKLDTGEYEPQYKLGMELGIGSAQLSHYITGRTEQPALDLAKRIYEEDGIVIWPYSKEAVGANGEQVYEK